MFRPGPPRDRLELPARFGFLDCEVDCEAIRATRAGRELSLEPRAFDLLLLLAANPGRVIEKEEIFERLWPGVVVGDNALTRVVAHLRRELGDSAEEARIVDTVRTRGYRFVPAIRALPESSPVAARASERAAASAPGPRGWGSLTARRGLLALAAAVAAGAVVLALVGPWREWAGPARSTWTPTPVQRTLDVGYRGGADFSPDGSQLVYSSDASGGLELFVRPLEGGREIQITSGGGPKVDAAWSPDGSTIAYCDLAADGIWLVAPTGGPPRQLTDSGSQPAWFPDGRRLVYSDPGRATVGSMEWPASYGAKLRVVELATGATHDLTKRDPETGGHGQPAVSADGRWVYFATLRHTAGGALWRVAATGGAPQRLTAESPRGAAGPELWLDPTPTPDGTALLAIQASVTRRIVRLALAGPGPVATLFGPVPAGVSGLALSRDGRRLVYAEERNRTSIEEAVLGPGGEVEPEIGILSEPATQRVLMPRYSPDGARVAFERRSPGTGVELVVIERAGGEPRTIPLEREQGIAWVGPARIALGWSGEGGELDLATGRRREDPFAAAAQRLAERSSSPLVARSPAVPRLALTGLAGPDIQELLVGDLASGATTQLTRLGRWIDYPFFSRDGRWICFEVHSFSGADNELWRVPAAGGAPERLRTEPGPSWMGAFSADGGSIVYAALRAGRWRLAIAGVAAPERLLDVPPETVGYLRWPDWSPDGRHIAYERMHYEASLWTLDLAPAP